MEFDQRISQTLLSITIDCINVPLDKGQEAIQSALEKVGKLLTADRGYIFDYDFKIRGFIGFDSVKNKHTYSTDDIELIQFLGEILINFKTRINASEELKRANNQLEKKVKERTFKLKKLNEELLQIEENEKKRLASDLRTIKINSFLFCENSIRFSLGLRRYGSIDQSLIYPCEYY